MGAAATGIFLNRGSASKKVPDTFSDHLFGHALVSASAVVNPKTLSHCLIGNNVDCFRRGSKLIEFLGS